MAERVLVAGKNFSPLNYNEQEFLLDVIGGDAGDCYANSSSLRNEDYSVMKDEKGKTQTIFNREFPQQLVSLLKLNRSIPLSETHRSLKAPEYIFNSFLETESAIISIRTFIYGHQFNAIQSATQAEISARQNSTTEI